MSASSVLRAPAISRAAFDPRLVGVSRAAFRRAEADLVRPVLSRAGVSELRLPARFAGAQTADTIAMMERRKVEVPKEIERLEHKAGDLTQRLGSVENRSAAADR